MALGLLVWVVAVVPQNAFGAKTVRRVIKASGEVAAKSAARKGAVDVSTNGLVTPTSAASDDELPWWRWCRAEGCPLPEHEKAAMVEVTERPTNPTKAFGSSSHCRLAAAMESAQKGGNVTFALAGGSASQGAGLKEGERHWWAHLGEKIQKKLAPNQPQLHNAAQGATDSFWSSLMGDSIIGDADVLFWEYAINDYKGGTTGAKAETPLAMRQALELWVYKAMQLPQKPALVFVYLYDQEHIKDGSYYSSALQEQLAVLDRFIKSGMDILVVPTGSALKSVNALNEVRASHHPGPAGHGAIADAVWRSVEKALGIGCPHANMAAAPPIESMEFVSASPILAQMLTMRTVSSTAIEPKFGTDGITQLLCDGTNASACSAAKGDSYGKVSSTRTDRKVAWAIPTCVNDKKLVLATTGDACSSAKYIGVHVGGGGYKGNVWFGRIAIKVNGGNIKILEKTQSLIGTIPFAADYNLWLDLEADAKGGECRQVSICMPDAGAVGAFGDQAKNQGRSALTYSPFADGGGRVDWATVFY